MVKHLQPIQMFGKEKAGPAEGKIKDLRVVPDQDEDGDEEGKTDKITAVPED